MASKKPPDGATASAKPRPRLNASKKRALKSARMAIYIKQVGRKAQKGKEPNDRHDWSELRGKIRQLSAKEMDLLIREDEDDIGK